MSSIWMGLSPLGRGGVGPGPELVGAWVRNPDAAAFAEFLHPGGPEGAGGR